MNLTVVGFVIAVIGLALQFMDAFPQHREVRTAIVLLALGIFLGIGASAVLGAKYNITGNVDAKYALLFAILGIAAVFGVIGVFSPDQARREMALGAAGVAVLIFLLCGVGIGIASARTAGVYSTDEVLLLANDAERGGEYEKAIERLNEVKDRITGTQAQAAIQKRISQLQAAQGGASVPITK